MNFLCAAQKRATRGNIKFAFNFESWTFDNYSVGKIVDWYKQQRSKINKCQRGTEHRHRHVRQNIYVWKGKIKTNNFPPTPILILSCESLDVGISHEKHIFKVFFRFLLMFIRRKNALMVHWFSFWEQKRKSFRSFIYRITLNTSDCIFTRRNICFDEKTFSGSEYRKTIKTLL